MHKACTLQVQLVHVVMSPCTLSPQQAHVGSRDVGLKKNNIAAGESERRRPWGMEGSALGSSKENSRPLAVPPLLAA